MTHNLTELFAEKEQQVQKYYAEWSALKHDILHLLGKNASANDKKQLNEPDQSIRDAIQEMIDELKNPRITLAATGTTSSGKSSLVNLLCGAEIMPTGVQEVSAGSVTIDYHPTDRTLKIPPVHGLPDEFSGEWENLSDAEIAQRLNQVMKGYIKLREQEIEPPAPHIELQYPIRLGQQPEMVGLPEGFRLRILDLPGLKFVADSHNMQVIRQEVKPALCLVTYDSAEVDPTKKKELLEQIVQGVRDLGGSPARMLFILNKIDVFLKNQTWEAEKQEFIETTTAKIQSAIAEGLPEYKEQAQMIEPLLLSTYPALCAYRALNGDTKVSNFELQKIDTHFNALVKHVIDELPRHTDKWKDFERKRVAEEAWVASHGDTFSKALRQHVEANIPQLLLPHLLHPISEAVGYALSNADMIINGEVNNTEKRYQDESNRLSSIDKQLQKLRNDSKRELQAILIFKPKSEDPIADIADVANELQVKYNIQPKDSLVPFSDWVLQFGRAIEEVLDSISGAILEKGSSPKGNLVESLPSDERKKLTSTLELLHTSGYANYAKSGTNFKATSSMDKAKLKGMKTALETLATTLTSLLIIILDRTAERESERIQEALQRLFEGYAQHISQQSQDVAEDLVGLSVTPSQLMKVKQSLRWRFFLDAGFHIHSDTESVFAGTEKVKVGEEQVQVGHKRSIWQLWLKKHPIYETRDKYETKNVYKQQSYDIATIPPIIAIIRGFLEQLSRYHPEEEFSHWFQRQIDEFLRDIDRYQEDLIKSYRQRLEQARARAAVQKQEDVQKWEPLKERINSLRLKRNELVKVE